MKVSGTPRYNLQIEGKWEELDHGLRSEQECLRHLKWQSKITNTQLEIQSWSSEKRSGLETPVNRLSSVGRGKSRVSSKEPLCLGVRNRESSPDQRAEDTSLQSQRLVKLKERKRKWSPVSNRQEK